MGTRAGARTSNAGEISCMTIQCDSCGKRFNASDALAGKRVRCRGCGEIISVPKLETLEDDGFDDLVETPAPKAPKQPARNYEGGRLTGGNIGRTVQPVSDEIGYEVDDDDDSASTRNGGLRPNMPLPFPGSELVDRLLPYFLLFLSIGWILAEMLRNNEIGPMWVTIVRIGTFLAIYLVAVWPVTRYGSAKGAEQAGVELPPNHAWRVMTTFIFPATLGYILWSINGGMGSFIAGAVVGLVIAMGAYYVLFRLKPEEAGKAMPWVGGLYVASVVAGVAAFVGLNFATMTIMAAGRTAHEYATSPLGRHLPWDPPVPPEDATRIAERNIGAGRPTTVAPALPTTTIAAPTTQSADATTVPSDTVETATTAPTDGIVREGIAGAAGQEIEVPEPINRGITGNVVTIEPTTGNSLFGEENTQPAPVPAVTPEAAGPAKPVTEIGTFSAAIFPITPSRHVLIVRPSATITEDKVEVWDLSTKQKTGETVFQRDPGQSPDYALSPDGKTIARLNEFPTLSVMTWSVADNRPGKPLLLNKTFGEPSILGFSENAIVWVRWNKFQKFGLEGFDTNTTQRVKATDLTSYVDTPAGVAISPDGKLFACVRETKGLATHELAVMFLRTGQTQRRLPLVGIDAQFADGATGIAFSNDSSKVALVLERNNQGVLMDWIIGPAGDGKPVHQHLFPGGFAGGNRNVAGMGVRRSSASPGRKLEWLADGNGWLINGTAMYNADTGLLAHDLGVPTAVSQRVVDGTTIEIVAKPQTSDANTGPQRTGSSLEILVADPSKLGTN